ncbi:hypothetical protein ACA910_005844 [Epithemia clementina (nom. ined.)]
MLGSLNLFQVHAFAPIESRGFKNVVATSSPESRSLAKVFLFSQSRRLHQSPRFANRNDDGTVNGDATDNRRDGTVNGDATDNRRVPTMISADNDNLPKPMMQNHTTTNSPALSTLVYYQQPTISPYHILHPLVSPSLFEEFPVDRKPLYRALHLMQQALTEMQSCNPDDFSSLVRIEHPITYGSIDPLAWISSQHQRLVSLSPTQLSYFYCQNQEEDLEVAAIGAIYTCNATEHVWSFLERPDWPHSSRWYGGQRFDPTLPLDQQSPEWKDFGSNAWWFLPTMELRREKNQTILSVHVIPHNLRPTLELVQRVTDQCMERRPPTTMPPVLSRSSGYKRASDGTPQDGQELYEEAVVKAIKEMEKNATGDSDAADPPLKKVVLSRVQRMRLGVNDFCALAVLRRWKYGGNEGGHLFWMKPGLKPGSSPETTWNSATSDQTAEFFGCAPERLFRVQATDSDNLMVRSEALAGTRPRGSTVAEDTQLLQDLLQSPKDRNENQITGDFVGRVFAEMQEKGLVLPTRQFSSNLNLTLHQQQPRSEASGVGETRSNFFVRRLLHLQHLCQSFEARLSNRNHAMNATRFLMTTMHPTPAVCGDPVDCARDFIRKYESTGFDRGFYAGPVGYLGLDSSDIFVALRSALLTNGNSEDDGFMLGRKRLESSLLVYAGAGIVPGSTVKGEWAETNYKLAVISSVFPQSPMTLQGAQTPNVAWAAAFLEELIRNGVTQFYVCPGSRSTPLVVALSRAARSRVGVVQVTSVHDERSAAFRAVGYARGANRPAAVVTSSGTAVANLYPAIVEASMDGVPLLLLTADRPYENRDTGANQAIDQVKIFSSTYTRWFRDILPPSDDVPISVALSDAGHAVYVAQNARGPVHLNIQFRENLAPNGGPIRNDDRTHSTTRFNAQRFTETPRFERWSITGNTFNRQMKSYTYSEDSEAARELSQLISKSRRGIIVVGHVRSSLLDEGDNHVSVADTISDFAQHIGFPILAGVQQVALRFRSTSVVLFAEHILKCPEIANNLKPDLVVQIGAPLVSSEIPSIIVKSSKDLSREMSHVLIHQFASPERIDPGFTVTHHISADCTSFLKRVSACLTYSHGSELSPLVLLGKRLQGRMKHIVGTASEDVLKGDAQRRLSEPEVIVSLSESYTASLGNSLFLSNSMPIRDAEFFLYPLTDSGRICSVATGSNRGASGIDGVISSAVGFAEATGKPTTLVIGDVSALHDIGSLHNLAEQTRTLKQGQSKRLNPITTVVINNNGGGIFSFLPIARHGDDVSFEEFFGTPTESFSFEKAGEAFGLQYTRVTEINDLYSVFSDVTHEGTSGLVEVVVAGREQNVLVHKKISQMVAAFLERTLATDYPAPTNLHRTSLKTYSNDFQRPPVSDEEQTLVLLHGWMGDKTDWDEVGLSLSGMLPSSWSVKAIDLSGHGERLLSDSLELENIRRALNLPLCHTSRDFSVHKIAEEVVGSLRYHGVKRIDALAGYSLGGRVALNIFDRFADAAGLVHNETRLVLVSSFTESKLSSGSSNSAIERMAKDDKLSEALRFRLLKSCLHPQNTLQKELCWDEFLDEWYASSIWAGLKSSHHFPELKRRRSKTLDRNGHALADILSRCSPPRNRRTRNSRISPASILLIAGKLDEKYCNLLRRWGEEDGIGFEPIGGVGHAVLVEAPFEVSRKIANFLVTRKASVAEGSNEDHIEMKSLSPMAEAAEQTDRTVGNGISMLGMLSKRFSLDTVGSGPEKSESGLGWGNKVIRAGGASSRNGLLVQFETTAENGVAEVGIGEIAPLNGVHEERLDAAVAQFQELKDIVEREGVSIDLVPEEALRLRGYLKEWIQTTFPGIQMLPSVRAGVEMALLGLAAQKLRTPLHHALLRMAADAQVQAKTVVEVNGLLTRSSAEGALDPFSFRSMKVKVGHRPLNEDQAAIQTSLDRLDAFVGRGNGRLRLDANQAWNFTEASEFTKYILSVDYREQIEFIEEPLSVQNSMSFFNHVQELESWSHQTRLQYALDESIADLARAHAFEYSPIEVELLEVFKTGQRGCAALVLKPAFLGLELSMQLARLARQKLKLGAVFSSSFESGVGLAYFAFLSAAADALESESPSFAHGLGTFALLDGDTMTPPFSSYINDGGMLNVASLSRAIYGLSLHEMILEQDTSKRFEDEEPAQEPGSHDDDLSTVVSIMLPFSAKTAHGRFTDLPQQPRWSPWLSSVLYQGEESEWKINIRGISFKWRAKSQLLDNPWLGIQWESVSGVPNRGTVEFIPKVNETCEMRVCIAIKPPRVLNPLFRRAESLLLKDFIRDKIIKWSLEMFRDVVKADLAIERGDVELGDALFGAVEGKASAIEATLKSSTNKRE